MVSNNSGVHVMLFTAIYCFFERRKFKIFRNMLLIPAITCCTGKVLFLAILILNIEYLIIYIITGEHFLIYFYIKTFFYLHSLFSLLGHNTQLTCNCQFQNMPRTSLVFVSNRRVVPRLEYPWHSSVAMGPHLYRNTLRRLGCR